KAAGLFEQGEIQAGLRQLVDVLDRQVVERALVLVAGEHEAVGVYGIGDLRNRFAFAAVPSILRVEFPRTAPRIFLVSRKEIRQFVVVHAQELDIDFIDVDRYHRQPARLARRQDAALGGKSDRRFERSRKDALADFAAERLAVDSRKFAPDAHAEGSVGLHIGKMQGG